MKILFTFIIYVLLCFSTYSQNGLYLEYNACLKGTSQTIYVLKVNSINGNSINELENLQYSSNSTTLTLSKEQDTAYRINSNMTYFKMSDKQLSKYKIKVLSKDSVSGFHCTKIAVTTHDRSDDAYAILWVSDEVPFYERYLMVNINGFNLAKLNDALKEQNLTGIPIRIAYSEENSLQYDLLKTAFVDLDKSMFSLENYKEMKMLTSDELKRQNKVNNDQYKAMKIAEEEAIKHAKEQAKKKN